nr:hypothetical protein RAR13_09705 [Aminobacter aminovorans]
MKRALSALLALPVLLASLVLSHAAQADTKTVVVKKKAVISEESLPALDKKPTGSVRPASDAITEPADKTGKDPSYPPALWFTF